MRLMVEVAELVCSVPKVKWPVSAIRRCRLDGFQIAHFADQHHIRVFTKCGAQGVGKALGVGMQFTLVNHAVLIHVHELDRILDGEDVIVPLAVDLVDHGRQRCGFAGAGRPRYQHQAARLIAELAHHGGQAELVERLDFERNQTEDSCGGAALVEHVGAEAGQPFQSEGEIQFKAFFEAVLLRVVITL